MAMTPFRDDAGPNNSNGDGSKSLGRSLLDGSCSLFNKPFGLWDPFEHMNSVCEDGPMYSLLQDVRAIAGTKVDWKETSDAHIFKADLPGLNKDEVKLTIEDGRMLQITGERNKEKEEKTETRHRVERYQGGVLKRFHLPDNANVDQIQAKIENGILTVTVPKTDRSHRSIQRQIEIK